MRGKPTVSLTTLTQLQAQTAVSNLGQGVSGSVGFIGSAAGGPTTDRLWEFTTGSAATSYNFTGITVPFITGSGAPPTLTVGLYSSFDATSFAGVSGLVTSLSLTSGNPLTAGNSAFSGTASLTPSTTYYLLLDAGAPPNGNAYNIPFAGTYSVDSGGLAGWTMLGGHEVNIGSFNGPGGTVEQWTLYPDAGQFSVQATAVPEPSTYAVIAGAAMLGVALMQRRRRTVA